MIAVIVEQLPRPDADPRDFELAAGLQDALAGIDGFNRLRVATVTRDYGLSDRGQAPADSQATLI